MSHRPRTLGSASPCNHPTTLQTRAYTHRTRLSELSRATSFTDKASRLPPRFQSSEVRVPPAVSGPRPIPVRPTISADSFLDYTSTLHCLWSLTRYRMVSDEKYQGMISWNATGTSFYITRVQEFAATVLPLHFKHSNFSSFVRQLNMYVPFWHR